jgi:hypothetical protein
MFQKLTSKLGALFAGNEARERDAYLSEAVDFVDLERRIQYLEMNHQPYTLYSGGAPRDYSR